MHVCVVCVESRQLVSIVTSNYKKVLMSAIINGLEKIYCFPLPQDIETIHASVYLALAVSGHVVM